jgi:hypothetical protein
MKNYLLLLFSIFLLNAGCVADASENKLYHQADLHEDLWKEDSTAVEQVYAINTDTITTLICEKGTKLIIPARAFVLEEDPAVPAKVRVELRVIEVYNSVEMFRYHLNTQREGGQLLESAGMVYLQAYAEGKKLQLKEGKEILLGFPKKKGFTSASLSSNTESADGSMRWEKEENRFELKQAILDTYFSGENASQVQIILGEEEQVTDAGSKSADNAGAEPVNSRYPVVLIEDENITDSISLVQDFDQYHFFRSHTLDWLNCERLVEEEVTDVQLSIAGFPANTLYYMVFDDINSLVTGSRKEGEPEERNTVFEKLPVGSKAALIAIYNKEGLYYLAHQDIRLAPGQPIELKPEKIKKSAITNYLQELGKVERLSAVY